MLVVVHENGLLGRTCGGGSSSRGALALLLVVVLVVLVGVMTTPGSHVARNVGRIVIQDFREDAAKLARIVDA